MRLSKEQIQFIEDHQNDDVRKLALQKSPLSREETLFALMQIEARQRLKDKLPTILGKQEFVFPTRISTEQASSEATARLKENILNEIGLSGNIGNSADLTGGLGIDTIFMARRSRKQHYVEINPEHAKAAENNLPLFLDNVTVHNTDAESFIRETDEQFDFVYADPARRNESNGKLFRLEDCMPNILDLKPLIMSKSKWLIVKLSPMLDLTQAIEKIEAEKAIIVSVNDECKEMIVVCGHSRDKKCTIEAIEINKKGIYREQLGNPERLDNLEALESPDSLYGLPEAGMTLYEPFAAMMKAGKFKELAVRYGAKMIAPSSHLFFTEIKPASETGGSCGLLTESETGISNDFPGRKFIVKEVTAFAKKSIKDIKKANITVRNFPMSVAEIRKSFNVSDGGDLYLFFTTDTNGKKIIIHCEKIR